MAENGREAGTAVPRHAHGCMLPRPRVLRVQRSTMRCRRAARPLVARAGSAQTNTPQSQRSMLKRSATNASQHWAPTSDSASILSVHPFASAPRSCTLIGQRRPWALPTAIYPCRGSDGAGRGFSAERHSTHGTSHSRPPRRHVPLRFVLGRRTQATCGLGTQGDGY